MDGEAAAQVVLGFVETAALPQHGGEIVDDRDVVGQGAERGGEEANRFGGLAGLRQRGAIEEHELGRRRRRLQRQAKPMLGVREAALPQRLLAGADEVSRVRVRHRAKRSEKRFTKCLTRPGHPGSRRAAHGGHLRMPSKSPARALMRTWLPLIVPSCSSRALWLSSVKEWVMRWRMTGEVELDELLGDALMVSVVRSAGVTGRVKTAFKPGSLSSSRTAPPCSVATALTKLRPRPLPGVERLPSRRTKRSKTTSRRSGGMPGPVSVTSTRAASPSRPTDSDTVPDGVYFSALSSRLAIACDSRWRSPRTGSVAGTLTASVRPLSSATGSYSSATLRAISARSLIAALSRREPASASAMLSSALNVPRS